MKKVCLLALALAMCLALLAGCAGAGGGEPSAPPADDTQTAEPAAPADTAAPAEETGGSAPAGPVTYPDDYIVPAGAEWEPYCHIEGGGVIEGLNFAPDGSALWVIDPLNHNIYRIIDGEAETVFHDESAMPNGAKFIDDKTLLITDRARGLCKFDIETLEYTTYVPDFNGTPFLGPNDLALDGEGGAFFTDPGPSSYTNPNGQVFYIDDYFSDNPTLTLVESGIAYPNGIVLSPDHSLIYFAEWSSNSIICAPSPTVSTPVTTYLMASLTGGHGPDGLTIDDQGNIYAAHVEAGEVVVIDPNGWTITVIRMPEGAGTYTDNLIIYDGYLYVCEFAQSIVWRIPVNTASGEWEL